MKKLNLGTDLSVLPFFQAHDAAAIDLATSVRRDRTASGIRTDFATFNNRQNLAQALILRLLTPRGSLAELGHRNYGSRLHQLIGRPKNSAIRDLCRVFVLETLAQEPRIEDKAISFNFDLQSETPGSLNFLLEVQPHGDHEPLPISLEVSL